MQHDKQIQLSAANTRYGPWQVQQETENHFSVYVHIAPNGKRYVGITGTPVEVRWGKNGNRYKENSHFKSAILKYGWDNIKHVVLFSLVSREYAEAKEIELIAKWNTTDPRYGYNIEPGGFSPRMSEDTKAKLSESHKGILPWNTGKHLSEDTRRKISEALSGRKGHPCSEEAKAKMRVANKGKHHSEETKSLLREQHLGMKASDETKAKMSATRKGVPKSRETRLKMTAAAGGSPVRCIETGEVFVSIKEAEKETGTPHTTLSKHLKGNCESAGGLHWERWTVQ